MKTNHFLRSLAEKVAPRNAALIVVDVQNDFCADKGVFAQAGNDVSMCQHMVPTLQRLLDGARTAGIPVIFVQSIYDPVFLPPTWQERNSRLGFETPRCLSGTWGSDFYMVAPQPDEPVVRKHRYSAFVGTDLDVILRSQRIQTVIVTGVVTNLCVESTARDAFMRDYYVVVPSDTCAAYGAPQHDAALQNISIGFGVTTTTTEVIDAWGKSR